jgi:hypothetical protein
VQLTRVQVDTPYVLTRVFTVDDAPADAAGTVTVTVRRLDGTLVETVDAGHPGPVGAYTYTSAGRNVLDALSIEWAGVWAGANVKARDAVEIVGGFMFEVADARNRLGGLAKYSTATILDRRNVVEQEADRVAGHAFVPRFKRVKLSVPLYADGCRLALPSTEVRTVRAVTEDGTAWSPAQLAATTLIADAGVLYGEGVFFPGVGRYVVEYEHGLDGWDPTVREVAIQRLKYWLGAAASQIPPNALSFTVQDGGVYRLSQPGRQSTGDLAVDAVYRGNSYDGPF